MKDTIQQLREAMDTAFEKGKNVGVTEERIRIMEGIKKVLYPDEIKQDAK